MLDADTTPATNDEVILADTVPRVLRCIACRSAVTARSEAVRIAGAHTHEFSNPAGERFRIGCFSSAPGALAHGEASDYWSWFDGYRWRVAACRACGLQLGWHFGNSGGHGFFGLILAALVEND